MHHRKRLSWGLLALVAACGPKLPGDGGSESGGGSSGDATSGATGEPEPTGGAPGSATAGTSDEPAPTTGEPGTGTGEPATCPEGQQRLAPLWRLDIELPPDLSAGVRGPIGRMSDGRIVLAAELSSPAGAGPGVLLVSPGGEFLGAAPLPGEDTGETLHMMRIGADDRPLLLVEHEVAGEPLLALRRFDDAGAPLGGSDLESPRPKFLGGGPYAFALGGASVIAGFDLSADGPALVRTQPGSEQLAFMVALNGPASTIVRAVAVGPDGSIVVAGGAEWDVGFRRLVLARFSVEGFFKWRREIETDRFDDLTGLDFAADEQLVALRAGGGIDGPRQVTLLAVEVADGATRWELPVATPDAAGNPWASDLLVDGDTLTIPISRNESNEHEIVVASRFIEVARVSLQGEKIDAVPVPGALAGSGVDIARAVRGRCGELVLSSLDSEFRHRVEAFAP